MSYTGGVGSLRGLAVVNWDRNWALGRRYGRLESPCHLGVSQGDFAQGAHSQFLRRSSITPVKADHIPFA